MTEHTTNHSLPYPDGSDGPDGAGQVAALALALDTAIVYRTVSGITSRWNGTVWQPWDSDWASITGGLVTSGIGVSYTTCQSRYRGGKLVVRAMATITSVGSGSIQFTLPSALDAAYTALLGNGYINKSGTKYRIVPDYGVSSTQVVFRYQSDLLGGTTVATVSAPVTLAAGDEIEFMIEVDV